MKKSALGPLFLLVATNLILGCAPSNKVVQLKDPSKPEQVDGNGNSQKPEPTPDTSPTPAEPGDGGDPVPTPPAIPTPTPIPDVSRVARIMCESQPYDGRAFNTLRADVFSSYIMPTITPYVNGRYVLRVKSPVPLQSNGREGFVVMRAQEDEFSPWKIYKSSANLLTQKADLQVLSNFEGPVYGSLHPYLDVYRNLKMEAQFLTANFKRSAYVYPNDKGTYIWENMKGSRIVLPFNASESFSPFFVGADDYVRFDQLSATGGALTQKFYNFDTKSTISLPAPIDSKDSQLFGYVNAAKTTIFWVEGRADGAWKIRSIGLRAGSKAVTITTLPGNPRSVVLPMVFLDHGETVLAFSEEESVRDTRGQASIVTATLHLVTASAKQLKVLNTQSIPYGDDFKMYAKPGSPEGILRNLFLEPISGKLYASNIPKGGLISFDLKNKSWGIHAMYESVFGCLNPQWGLEVPRD
ncbi:hypothetical protein [Bdellovibrio sp. HCB337]|uniref:hypothetical protein n=1 Tax=Bdellovibrio sp. HCB337 TaxID=3394358 RepID=UPI0039A6AFE3